MCSNMSAVSLLMYFAVFHYVVNGCKRETEAWDFSVGKIVGFSHIFHFIAVRCLTEVS